MSLANFLTQNSLSDYIKQFEDQGLTDLEDILELAPSNWTEIADCVGMQNPHASIFIQKLGEYKNQINGQNQQSNSDMMEIDEVQQTPETQSEEMVGNKEGNVVKRVENVKMKAGEYEKLRADLYQVKEDILGLDLERYKMMVREMELMQNCLRCQGF